MRRIPATGDMSVAECWDRLQGAACGFVALSARALPVVLPVQYYVQDGLIVICLGPDAPFHPVLEDVVVAFAVESINPATSSGWTVHVQGILRADPGAWPACPTGAGRIAHMEPIAVTGWHVELCPLLAAGRPTPVA